MKRTILGIIIMAMTFEGFAKSYEKDCFSLHIRESIAINSARKPLYHRLTNGQSDKIFNFLLTSEYASLIPAKYYDLKARTYQENGVPLFCYEFMSMTKTPDFEGIKKAPLQEDMRSFDWKDYKRDLDKALEKKDVESIKDISLQAVRRLEEEPHYHCFMRHMIESIYRFAYFLPMQEEASLGAGLPSSAALSFKVIKLQSLTLISANQVDLWSAPIQKSGIPILCSELPRLLDDL